MAYDAALFHHDGPLGQVENSVEVLFHEKNGHAKIAAYGTQDIADELHDRRLNPLGRFVQEHQYRIAYQGAADGSPSDLQTYRQVIPEVRNCNFGLIVACAAGPKAKQDLLLELTDRVVTLDTMDSSAFSGFFKWVSASVSIGSSSAGVSGQLSLPPPPPEVQIAL